MLASFHRAVRTHGQERHTPSGLLSVHKWNPHTMEGYFLTNNLSLMNIDTCFVGHCPDSEYPLVRVTCNYHLFPHSMKPFLQR